MLNTSGMLISFSKLITVINDIEKQSGCIRISNTEDYYATTQFEFLKLIAAQ